MHGIEVWGVVFSLDPNNLILKFRKKEKGRHGKRPMRKWKKREGVKEKKSIY